MANILQTVTAPVDLRPLVTAHSTPAQRERTSEPFAQLIHTQDAVALDGSTGTDTFNIAIEMELPPNYAYKLERANVSTSAATANVWGQMNAQLRVYPATSPAIAPGATTELVITMEKSSIEGLGEVQSGNAYDYSVGGSGHMSCPILFGYVGNSGPWPRFTLGDSEQDVQTDIKLSYWFTWLVYSLEQVNNAAIHWPMPITPSG